MYFFFGLSVRYKIFIVLNEIVIKISVICVRINNVNSIWFGWYRFVINGVDVVLLK